MWVKKPSKQLLPSLWVHMGQLPQKIKLLHLIGAFLHGGTERLMLDILSRLPEDIYDITACCDTNHYLPDVVQAYQQAGIKTVAFSQPAGLSLVRDLAQLICRERFQIVHTHHYYGNLYGRIAAILSGVPIIMTYQHNWPGDERGHHRLAFRGLNRRTYRNITVSDAIRRYDIEQVGLSPHKVITLHNGVDIKIFRPPSAKQRLHIRQELGLPPTITVVGMAGRLVDWKRFDLFIKAASIVLRRGRMAHFLVVGDGEMHDSLVQLAQQLDVEHQVHFLGWQSDMASIYQAMDVFCLTSDSGGRSLSKAGGEGFGLVSIEAMASGVPVVAVDTGVNREVISEACGLFCVPTPDDLAAKICQLIDSPPLKHRLGQNGRARAIERFDIVRTADRLSTIYFQAVRDASPT